MVNVTNKVNLFMALVFGFLFVLMPNIFKNFKNLLINEELIFSILIYSLLSYLALKAFSSNKIAGMILLVSISLISPNIYENFKGELYPITIVIFLLYFGYNFGIKAYKKWKSSF
ncbi:MAG: hypothetical protein EVA29_02895 [Candidatus Actinomarinales bacterium]|nr:MAG: hypothetical protein EVA29_02895 [Candidatus Actinomarinales bacterium]